MGVDLENTQVGPFYIERRLGRHRRQRVFRARQIEQNREVAIKFLTLPPHRDRQRTLEKLQAEFALLRTLRHPHLVRNYGAGVAGNQVFFAMELVAGESLAQLLSRRGKLSSDLVVDIARQVAMALEFIHAQHLLHLKLTPEKVLIDPDGRVKVADLRYHRRKKKSWHHHVHRDLELMAYLAPEHIAGHPTERSDLYSLGVMMFEMLTGQLPCPPETLTRMIQNKSFGDIPRVADVILNCPVMIDQLVKQLLQSDPKLRPHSAAAVRGFLEEYHELNESGQAVVSKLAAGFSPLTAQLDREAARSVLRRSQSVRQSPRWRWWVFGFAMLAALLVVAMFFWRGGGTSSRDPLARGLALVNSEDPAAWSRAKSLLAQIGQRLGEDDPRRDEVRQWREKAQQKLILYHAARGETTSLHTQAERTFIDAWRWEQERNFERAAETYFQVEKLATAQNDDLYLVALARQRIGELHRLLELPAEREALSALIEQLRHKSQSGGNIEEIITELRRIIRRFSDVPELGDVLQRVARMIEELETHAGVPVEQTNG